nr:MAG TPA: Protein of unknown function (DUF2554) [Caudoviricetes sp.]
MLTTILRELYIMCMLTSGHFWVKNENYSYFLC